MLRFHRLTFLTFKNHYFITMDRIETEINNLTLKIDAIEQLLKKPFKEWTEEEKEEFESKEQLREERKQLREERKQLRDKEQELLKQQTILLQREQNQGIASRDGDPLFPAYDPSPYQVFFPFFESNGESYLTLRGRDDVVKQINDTVQFDPKNRRVVRQKYWPIVISTSRGMGKTFLLKMIGLQKVKDELKNDLIVESASCGRILSFDFAKDPTAIQSAEDVKTFFSRLMIYFLCLLFDGRQVDGINFEEIKLFHNVNNFHGRQKKFNSWKLNWIASSADRMIDEYLRLTNIAFAIPSTSERFRTPPVFLLDEIQSICQPTSIISKQFKGGVETHTLFSLLLTELAGRHRPICICTGTNNGDIVSITEMSTIAPQIFSLTPLVNDYLECWNEMTLYLNKGQTDSIEIKNDEELINCLAYASYQIPRLLLIAHQVWYTLRQSSCKNKEYFMQKYEDEAIKYYKEIGTLFTKFTVSDISHIILCCGVHWSVGNLSAFVPGTKIQWSFLIDRSIVFPYLDNCFLFPFTLVWRDHPAASQTTKNALNDVKAKIVEVCKKAVGNLNVEDLFLSFDFICKCDLYNLGICYETLFVSSLAVKYYIWNISQNSKNDMVPFSTLYDFGGAESSASQSLLAKFNLNLSNGILFPATEAFVNQNLPLTAIIHNKAHHGAHHDIILSTVMGAIAISAKASFSFSAQKLKEQMLVSKNSAENVTQLILLYLGGLKDEGRYTSVAFLNGSGVCNGLSLDILILVKKLKSSNNK
jgi:hypothetical protein